MRARRSVLRFWGVNALLCLAAPWSLARAQEQAPSDPQPPTPDLQAPPQASAWAEGFRYHPERFQGDDAPLFTQFRVRAPLGEQGFYEFEVEYPTALPGPDPENNRVPCRLLVPKGGARRCMIVFPFYTETTLLASKVFFARAFVDAGLAVFIMPLAYQVGRTIEGVKPGLMFASEDLKVTLHNWRQSALDAGRAKHWLREVWGFQSFGLFGISLGGVVGAQLFAIDDEYDVAVLIIAGGHLAKVMWADALGFGPGTQLRAAGADYEAIERDLRVIEPLTYAARAQPRRDGILMINALEDEVILPEDARVLWQAFGEPEIRWVEGKHRQSAQHWLFEADSCAEFARAAFERAVARRSDAASASQASSDDAAPWPGDSAPGADY